jgi:O-antigen/teichoic acid export membrane protein
MITATELLVPDEGQGAVLATPSLKSLAIRGSMWTMGGFGFALILRLGNSLLLTRLLFPSAFGTVTIVMVFVSGLQMFSDVGIGPSIIQSKRGDDQHYLNTAWTVQVFRGLVLSMLTFLLAFPVARFYGNGRLVALISVAGLGAAISGFQSVSMFTARRHLAVSKLVLLQFYTQVIGMTAALILAWSFRSVWALVFGGLISNLGCTVLSYLVLPGPHARFGWQKESRSELFNFGKWVFPSTALTFVAGQTDRLLLGKWIPLATLGVYGVAGNLIEPVTSVATQLIPGVLFPAYGRVARNDPDRLAAVFYKARFWVELVLLPGIGFLVVSGSWVVRFLYDARYQGAGWILQALSVRAAAMCISLNLEALMVAMGKPVYAFAKNLVRAVWIVSALPLGWHWGGLSGVVWAVALSEVPVVIVLWCVVWRHGLWRFMGELWSVLMFGAGAAAGVGVNILLRAIYVGN